MAQKAVFEHITPTLAKKYLNHNKVNRTLRPGLVEKYTSDMTAGTWTACAANIIFYEDGDIADGQHRLWAIVESGTPQDFWVVRDFPKEAALNVDTGAIRTAIDNARIGGIGEGLSNAGIAIARAVETGKRTSWGTLTNTQKLGFFRKHEEAIKFATAHGFSGKNIRSAVSNAAFARA